MPHTLPPFSDTTLSAEQLQSVVDQELRELATRCHLQEPQLQAVRKELLRDLVVEELERAAEHELAAADPLGTLLKKAFVAWVRKDHVGHREHSLEWLKQSSGVELGQAVHIFCSTPPVEMLLRDFALEFEGGSSHLEGTLRLRGVTLMTDKQGQPVDGLLLPLVVKLRTATPSKALLLHLGQTSA